MAQELEHFVNPAFISCAEKRSERLRELASRDKPEVILLEDKILNGMPLAESLAAMAPVILIAPYSSQVEVGRLIAAGQVELVPRANEFGPSGGKPD